MLVYRAITLNENEKIDTANLGISWTLCQNFAVDHGESMKAFLKSDDFEVFQTEVTEDQIDWDNTLFAMETRHSEYEVVLLPNTKIKCGYTGQGGNFEDYLNPNGKYEGEITKKDFLNLASEF